MMVPLADPVSKDEILSRSAAIRFLHTRRGGQCKKIHVAHFLHRKFLSEIMLFFVIFSLFFILISVRKLSIDKIHSFNGDFNPPEFPLHPFQILPPES